MTEQRTRESRYLVGGLPGARDEAVVEGDVAVGELAQFALLGVLHEGVVGLLEGAFHLAAGAHGNLVHIIRHAEGLGRCRCGRTG